MLIRKGKQASFKVEGRIVSATRGAWMLHDPSGKEWGKCSVLFLKVRADHARPATDDEMSGAPRDYLGREHRGRVVEDVELPPRSLFSWTRVGSVDLIKYSRQGTKGPGRWHHPFGVRSASTLYRKGKLPVLYKRGDAMRLELGAGCHLDDRGYVYP